MFSPKPVLSSVAQKPILSNTQPPVVVRSQCSPLPVGVTAVRGAFVVSPLSAPSTAEHVPDALLRQQLRFVTAGRGASLYSPSESSVSPVAPNVTARGTYEEETFSPMSLPFDSPVMQCSRGNSVDGEKMRAVMHPVSESSTSFGTAISELPVRDLRQDYSPVAPQKNQEVAVVAVSGSPVHGGGCCIVS